LHGGKAIYSTLASLTKAAQRRNRLAVGVSPRKSCEVIGKPRSGDIEMKARLS
jgi:hypothetical protein